MVFFLTELYLLDRRRQGSVGVEEMHNGREPTAVNANTWSFQFRVYTYLILLLLSGPISTNYCVVFGLGKKECMQFLAT